MLLCVCKSAGAQVAKERKKAEEERKDPYLSLKADLEDALRVC